eukprot:jgi/Orpsp1_1/1181054/evm.model.c7180000075655.1
MKYYNLLSFLSIITIFVINTTYAFSIKSTLKNKLTKKEKNNSNTTGNENYFMIFVNNGSGKDGGHNKREEAEQRINSVIDEITSLIIDNIDTYENPSKLEKFEQKSNLLRKRSNKSNDSALAYTISSLDDRTIIYSYLSNVVAEKVEEIPNVMACVEDREIYFDSEEKGNKMNELEKLNEILKETQWSGVSVRENADIHLSLLSQGKFDGNSTTTYDKNYYYPSSAGKDIDIFILDTGFNFRHPEYANKDERTVKCVGVNNGTVLPSKFEEFCIFNKEIIGHHGLMVADVAGGLTHGVANKANIYGIPLYDVTEYPSETDDPSNIPEEDSKKDYEEKKQLVSNIFSSLKYVEEYMLRPYKAVFNLSLGVYLDEMDEKDIYIIDYLRDYIDRIVSKGAVFVNSAGNDTKDVVLNSKYPCIFENVICVGAIDNAGNNISIEIDKEISELKKQYELYESEGENGKLEELKQNIENLEKKFKEEEERVLKLYDKKIMDPENYRVASFSDFGKKVDIYAPGYALLEYKDINNKNIKDLCAGTSFSSPIVAGVAATFMSEHPEIKFDSKKMLEYLTEMGEKNIIEGILEGNPNVFVNIGKHSVYSGSDAIDEVETDGFINSDVEIDDIINGEIDDLSDSEIDDIIDSDIDDVVDSEVDEK